MTDPRPDTTEPGPGAPGDDPFAPLRVIDRLEVGPARIESRRVLASYRVVQDGAADAVDLIYTFEEAVFDPEEPESRNLAAMMTAQVALNYGLFCREIRFHGLFDRQDRRLLRDMAENTAREIYVNKLLKPNVFLTGPAARMPAVRRRTYLQARIVFTGPAKPSFPWKLWDTDRHRYCVLSSGGKDSLLGFGLLDELMRSAPGEEPPVSAVYPVFVNESGRHWFTALNAYRHFRDTVPATRRVWVNSDRVFSWMLRRLPFIRKDFASVRSDGYPLRLWTVAVFLFGVLPLLRRHRIGRLVVGDEYDTTVPTVFEGIRHYDGLYDQSRFFDQALSGYFLQKGWSVSQFSVLRPLSELLIQKTLVERYPHLQRHQTSCHATRKGEDRVVPCGRCEKCRRIVGMLLAVGADPAACGYTPGQVDAILEALGRRDLHQEAEGAEHLRFLLRGKDLLRGPEGEGGAAAEHPEVLRLRFHPEKSPIHGVPADLRRPLCRLLAAHADGAVAWKGRKWVETDPFSHPDLFRPYPFETAPVPDGASVTDRGDGPPAPYLWAELTWPDAQRLLEQVDIALLLVGAIEQHGPHLPLDTDAFDADYLARRVAEACSPPRPLVMPPVAYGVSYHHQDFPGTLSIGNETLGRLVYEIGMSAAENGIRKLVILNGHGGNAPSLNLAAQRINRDAHIFVCVDTGETSDVDIDGLVDTPNDVHAGEIETSTSLAVRPHLVRMDRAEKAVPAFSSRYLDFSSRRGVSWYAYTRKISESGVMGDPTAADARKGERIWEIMIAHLVALVEDLKQMTLDEIHHRRY